MFLRMYYDVSIGRFAHCIEIEPATPSNTKHTCLTWNSVWEQKPDEEDDVSCIMIDKTVTFLAAVYAALEEKPLTSQELALALGCTQARIKRLIRSHPDALAVLARVTGGYLYGIPGKVYARPVYRLGMDRIVEYLREHGPSPERAIYQALKMWYKSFRAAVESNPDVLVEEVRPTCRQGRPYHTVRYWRLDVRHE